MPAAGSGRLSVAGRDGGAWVGSRATGAVEPAGRRRVRVRREHRDDGRARGRRHLPRPDRDRHLELRRRLGPGGAQGRRAVASLLSEVGLEPELVESGPRRANVFAADPGRRPLAAPRCSCTATSTSSRRDADDWQVDPFSGDVVDDCVWGRGAVDMKDMDAMILAAVRDLVRSGERPPRDLVVALLADEEAGGDHGATGSSHERPDLIEGVGEAISEVGGFSTMIAGRRAYLLQTAEKGIRWLRLVAHGRAGHGSQVNDDNAVTRLCEAVARVGTHSWPLQITPTVRAFLDGVEELTGVRLDPEDPDALVRPSGRRPGSSAPPCGRRPTRPCSTPATSTT